MWQRASVRAPESCVVMDSRSCGVVSAMRRCRDESMVISICANWGYLFAVEAREGASAAVSLAET